MRTISELRPSPIAGQWYPADPRRLASQVDRYMEASNAPALNGEIVAIVVPHAGHQYSGPVAGHAFAMLRGLTPDLVAVISPMHYLALEPLLTTAHVAYATPLGAIPVDIERLEELDRALKSTLGEGLTRVAYDQEHSLEIELPFLQRAFAQPFHLLPVMVREQSQIVARELGKALAKVLRGRKAILVASSDLSHFYPQRIADQLDSEMLRQVEAFDPEGVLRVEEEGRGFACGRGALAAVLWAAKELGADQVKILNHATSGDVTGDYERVVGYGAAVVIRQKVD